MLPYSQVSRLQPVDDPISAVSAAISTIPLARFTGMDENADELDMTNEN